MTAPARILVVDDEGAIRFVLEETLTRDGHEVITAESGAAALTLLAKHHFDLALLDLRLGDMEGTEVLSVLRRLSPDTVAIMLTAHASMESAIAALRLGAHDYLFKPCETSAIRASVAAGLLKRQQMPLDGEAEPTGPPRFLQRGRLIVDVERHEATLDGHRLNLSPTEFKLLAHLTSAAPRVVSALELVREVQGYVADSLEARDVVRFHIHRLRQKVRAATGRDDLIRNVRGVGYVANLK